MDTADKLLHLLSEHWKIITALGSFIIGGGYLVARYRTSGMRKMLSAHNDILDDLQTDLVAVRRELNQSRAEYSEVLQRSYLADAEVARLKLRVEELEQREKELLQQIETTR